MSLDAEKQQPVNVHEVDTYDATAVAIIAQQAKEREESMTLGQAFSAYKKAVFWSIMVSMNIVMESYGTILLNSFYAYPSFKKTMGDEIAPGEYSIPPQWQTGLSLAATCSITVGIWLNGLIVDRFGREFRFGHKKIMMVSLFTLTGFIGLCFGAKSRGMLLAGQILSGIPWGMLNVIAPAYAIEVAPLKLRHYGPTFVNLCWVIGHLIGAGVLTGLLGDKTEWGWRIPFGLQWMWPVPLFIAACFCPDSPWWLIRHGRRDDAVRALKKLSDSSVNHEEVAMLIEHTVRLEEELNFGSTYASCFQGVDARRTEIATVALCSQALVGFIVQGFQTYLFTQAGLQSSDAFKLTLGTYGIAFVGTVISMPLQDRFNRRSIWLAGLWCMLFPMLTVAILGTVPQTKAIQLAGGCVLLIWFFCYGWSLGPLGFVVASEIGSAHLRQKTLSISRGAQYVVTVVNAVAAPYVLNPTAANLKSKAAYIPSAFIVILIVWSYFRLPESRNKSVDDLDIMFAKKLPARQFRDYVVTVEEELEVSKGAE